MTDQELFELPFEERQHFARCVVCGGWYDRTNPKEIRPHVQHEGMPEAFIIVERCPKCRWPMEFEDRKRDVFLGVWICKGCGAQKWTKDAPPQLSTNEYFDRIAEFPGICLELRVNREDIE